MNFSKAYRTWWEDEVILTVGPKRFTRRDLVQQLGVPNFSAAKHLDRALRELKITTVKQLHQTSPSELMALDKVGERAVFVAMCVVDTTSPDGKRTLGNGEAWLHADEAERRARRRLEATG